MHIQPGTFAALVRDYKASAKFSDYSKSTKETWGRELDYASRSDVLGPLPVDQLRPAVVQAYLDGWADKPGKQYCALAAIKQLGKWAEKLDLVNRDITRGVETGKPSGGHIPWTDEQIALAERHARPDLARAIVLGAWTGQRGSDLVRMGWGDITTLGGRQVIRVKQVKTGVEVKVPILPELAEHMATWKREPGPFIRNTRGGTYTREVLSVAWSIERDSNPSLVPLRDPPMHIHGLRGHACVRLYRDGLTTWEVSMLVGMHEDTVHTYVRNSKRDDNTLAAIVHLEQARNIKHPFGESRSKNGS